LAGNQLVQQLAQRIPVLATSLLSHVPDGALTLFTSVLSAFMISARFPKIRLWIKKQLSEGPVSSIAPAFGKVRKALGGWLKAQLKLSGMSLVILLAGFLILRVPYAPVWALLIAIVDAVPLLGTGTALVPWAAVCFLQGSTVRGIGLLGIFAVTALTRSTLEPRLVGRQLGLDPLMTLAALYAGFKLWGIGGMLLAPVLSVAVKELRAESDRMHKKYIKGVDPEVINRIALDLPLSKQKRPAWDFDALCSLGAHIFNVELYDHVLVEKDGEEEFYARTFVVSAQK